jgi:hypothetical protein
MANFDRVAGEFYNPALSYTAKQPRKKTVTYALAKEIKQRVRSRPSSVTYVLNEKEVTVEHDLNHLLFWLG